MRRYIIHTDRRATRVLVSSDGVCRWHVERLRLGCAYERFTLDAFQASETGRCLSPKLVALMNAHRNAHTSSVLSAFPKERTPEAPKHPVGLP